MYIFPFYLDFWWYRLLYISYLLEVRYVWIVVQVQDKLATKLGSNGVDLVHSFGSKFDLTCL